MTPWAAIPLMCTPLLAYATVLLALRRRLDGVREALIGAALIWGVWMIAMTEFLSAFRSLTVVPIALGWLGAVAAGLAWAAAAPRRRPPMTSPGREGNWMVPGIVVVVLGVFVAAVAAPPNDFDSMGYHMARIEHWMRQASIAPYATNIVRQVESEPWAAMAKLHVQILAGGSDAAANLVAWFGLVVCLSAVSWSVKLLRGGRVAQCLAAALALGTPTLLLGAASAQNDVCVAAWVMTAVVGAIGSLAAPAGPACALLAGGTALAVATKGTAIPLLAPVIAGTLWKVWRIHGLARAARSGGWVIAMVVMVNAGHWIRNTGAFGHPLGAPEHMRLVTTGTLDPRALVVNAIQHAAAHFATGIRALDGGIVEGVKLTTLLAGLEWGDPRITFEGHLARSEGFALPAAGLRRSEFCSGNAPGLLLFAGCLVLGILRPRREERDTMALAWWASAGFACLVVALKWQMMLPKLHAPWFAVAAVPTALLVSRRPVAGSLLGWGALLRTIPFLLWNPSRPLLPVAGAGATSDGIGAHPSVVFADRSSAYFACQIKAERMFTSLLDALRPLPPGSVVGLKVAELTFEYPLWRLARSRGMRISFIHVGVENATRRYADRNARDPEAIIMLDQEHPWTPSGGRYRRSDPPGWPRAWSRSTGLWISQSAGSTGQAVTSDTRSEADWRPPVHGKRRTSLLQ